MRTEWRRSVGGEGPETSASHEPVQVKTCQFMDPAPCRAEIFVWSCARYCVRALARCDWIRSMRVEQRDSRPDLSGVDWCAAQIRNKETTVRSAARFWERLPASRF